MASNLTVDSISKGATTVNTDEIVDTNSNQICKAWVNFNGTGTVAIRDSYNVSSVTDNGVGIYTINMTAALANADYSVVGVCGGVATNNVFSLGGAGFLPTLTTTTFTARTMNDAGSVQDKTHVCIQVFGD